MTDNDKKEKAKTYYQKNREKIKARTKERYWKEREKALLWHKGHREANKEKIATRKKDYYERNKQLVLATQKEYYEQNKEELYKRSRDRVKKYRKDNKDKINNLTAKRRSARYSATPKWLTKEDFNIMQEWYTIAKELQWLSEEPLHVDHIIPLQGKEVCGLHVPWNLQVLPASENISKGNRL